MIVYKEVQTKQQVPDKMICDRCKAEVHDKFGGGVGVGQEDFIEVRHEFGYGSDKDGEFWEFDLCEKCFEETIKEMHISVRKYSQSEFMKKGK